MQSPISVPGAPGWVAEFRAFIMRGNVVDLAIGIISDWPSVPLSPAS
jgi:hypothetical protein